MKMKILTAAIAAIGAVGSVQASTQAQAVLEVTNVLFRDNATGLILDASAFLPAGVAGGLFIADSFNLSPSVNGVTAALPGGTIGGAPIPLTVQCVTAACPGMAFATPFAPAVSPPLNDGAMAAVSLDGNPISGLVAPPNGGTDARSSALAQLTGNGGANTTSSQSLSAAFTFTPGANVTVRFDFDAFKYMLAYTDTPINAIAGVTWNMSIIDTSTNTEVFDWTPNATGGGIVGGSAPIGFVNPNCALTDSITAIFPASTSETCSGSYAALSPLLLAGTTYNLSINHQTQAVVNNLNPVPEPSSMLLAGLALAGLGFSARRKARH